MFWHFDGLQSKSLPYSSGRLQHKFSTFNYRTCVCACWFVPQCFWKLISSGSQKSWSQLGTRVYKDTWSSSDWAPRPCFLEWVQFICLLYQCVSNVCNWTTCRCEDIFKNTSIPSGVQNQWPMVRVKLSAGGGRDWNLGRIIAQALVQRGPSKRYFSQKSDEASLQSFLPYNLENYVNNDHVTTSFISTQNFVIVG